ncbi:MAG: DMT family transporter [Bacteroidetes bacterium]|nr:DMT family transporter [Bacteroidota bacterium]
MKQPESKWIVLIFLSLVWGSSFILIKKGLLALTPVQLGALRILISAGFLLIVGVRRIHKIKKHQLRYVVLSSLVGVFIPTFLFAFAQTKINSSIASILNSLTPLSALLLGLFVFGVSFQKRQIAGVFVGLAGAVLLIMGGSNLQDMGALGYSLLVVMASTCYATDVNIIKKYLHDMDPLTLATWNFIFLIFPTAIILFFSGFFGLDFEQSQLKWSLLSISVLAVFGTGVGKILFNRLIQVSSPVFAASVTYMMPVVSVFLGTLDGESLSAVQIFGGCIVLIGVYMTHKKKKETTMSVDA